MKINNINTLKAMLMLILQRKPAVFMIYGYYIYCIMKIMLSIMICIIFRASYRIIMTINSNKNTSQRMQYLLFLTLSTRIRAITCTKDVFLLYLYTKNICFCRIYIQNKGSREGPTCSMAIK